MRKPDLALIKNDIPRTKTPPLRLSYRSAQGVADEARSDLMVAKPDWNGRDLTWTRPASRPLSTARPAELC